jgi:dTDP-4-amino-4,6-dideoxygalactose transaminase
MTWAATANMVEALGGKSVFVEIDPETLQVDPEAVAAAVTDRTVSILPVHFGGAPCDMDPLLEISRRHSLWIFEDAAHGVGTLYKGKHVGLFDRLAAFSFHPIKNMTTGEGGMLTLTDTELAKKLRALRFHGLEKQAWNRYAEGGTPQVEIVLPGFKYNFMDMQAALGIHQLASVNEFNARRIELAALYHELFAEVPEIGRPGVPAYDHFHTWHLYVIKVLDAAGLSRDSFMAALRARNVGTGLHFRAVHTQPYYRDKYPGVMGTLPKSEWVSDRICSLPLFPDMTEDDVRYVVDAVKDVLTHAKD